MLFRLVRAWSRLAAALALVAAPAALAAPVAPVPLTPPPSAPQDAEGVPLFGPRAEPAPPDDLDRNAELAKALDALVATGDTVGLAVAVVRKGETRFMRVYGVRTAGGYDPVTPATVFRIASLSKGVTGTLAAIAIAEGRLSADTPAGPYAPGFRLAGGREKSLTVGHLLSHRTGLPRNAYDYLLEANVPVPDIVARYPKLRLQCPPGDCYAYQNIAFDFAGKALEAVTGKSYAALAQEKIFIPLGMETASVGMEGLKGTGNWAPPHVRAHVGKGALDYGPWRATDVREAYYRVPAAGGVNASLLDVVAWLKAQMGGAPEALPAYVRDIAHQRRTPSPAELARIRIVSNRFEQADYAFGWRRYVYAGHEVIAHSGAVDGGYAAQIAWLPKEEAGIVMLSNARPRRIWRILPTFLDIELGLPREDWLDIVADEPSTVARRPARAPAPDAEDDPGTEGAGDRGVDRAADDEEDYGETGW